MKVSVCLDIGATNTRIALIDENLVIHGVHKFSTADSGNNLFGKICAEIDQLTRGVSWEQVLGISIACAGPMKYSQGSVSPVYIPAWKDFPLKELLEKHFPCQVAIENDAKLFALGEALYGAGKDFNLVFGVVVSTGIGGGLVIHKKLYNGASGNAGHVGHAVVDYQGRTCTRGGIGCITTIASGKWLVDRYLSIVPIASKDRPRDISVEIMERKAIQGDDICLELFQDATKAIASLVVTLMNVLNPEIIVLGGGIVNNSDFVWKLIQDYVFERQCLDFTKGTQMVRSILGDEAALLGAAGLLFSMEKNS